MENNRKRSNLFVGIILIAAGALFLVTRLAGFRDWGAYWPFIIIGIGAAFFLGMALGGRNAGVLAIPGSIIVMIGLILLLQNWLSTWETWTYAWTLIVCAVGLGIAFYGMWSGSPELRKSGWDLARLGLVLFVVFGVLFELIFSFSSGVERLRSPAWPVILIVAGVGLFLYRAINLLRKREKISWDDRDLFWPVLFAGLGVLWLLVNLKRLPFDNLGVLIGLWPALLVAAGLDLLVGRRWPVVGALLGVLATAGLIWMAVNVDTLKLETRFPTLLGWEELSGGINMERISGSGVVKDEKRDVRSFNRIRIEGSGMAQITQGETSSLTITADENLLPYLISEVHSGELRIYVKPGYSISPSQQVRYTITVNNLAALDLSGSMQAEMPALKGDKLLVQVSGAGEVKIDDVQLNELDVKISGSGSVAVAGKASDLDLDSSGSASLKAEDLACLHAKVKMSGSGEALLWVAQTLEARLSGSAEVQYYGAPAVTQNTSGSASVLGRGQK
jgi:hypothetical protein